jgi:hypothetical protein
VQRAGQVYANVVNTPAGLWPSDHAGVVATLRLAHG